jgi:hypothetical protein
MAPFRRSFQLGHRPLLAVFDRSSHPFPLLMGWHCQLQSRDNQLRHQAICSSEVSCAHEDECRLARRPYEFADDWQPQAISRPELCVLDRRTWLARAECPRGALLQHLQRSRRHRYPQRLVPSRSGYREPKLRPHPIRRHPRCPRMPRSAQLSISVHETDRY